MKLAISKELPLSKYLSICKVAQKLFQADGTTGWRKVGDSGFSYSSVKRWKAGTGFREVKTRGQGPHSRILRIGSPRFVIATVPEVHGNGCTPRGSAGGELGRQPALAEHIALVL